ncbi:MAG: type IV toxin-antitoxin system AbiEi family antitoxin [Bacteroidetes bacterium]|nr:type IV toxin-antitoxin system AbiEi family antitoxin [Bacteroidota bacterium]
MEKFGNSDIVHYICMFTKREQRNGMNMNEPLIIGKALEILNTVTHFKGRWKGNETGMVDGVMEIKIGDQWVTFFVVVKKEMRNHQLLQIQNQAKANHPLIVIADKIFPKIKEELIKMEVAYLETCGNIFLKIDQVLVHIDGKKYLPEERMKTNRAFTKTGLKVLFLFLLDEEHLNRPFREIANLAGVALGNINYVMNDLRVNGFIQVNKDGKNRILNKPELLQKWMGAYNERLKPVLEIGRFRFLKADNLVDWRNIQMKAGKTCWGGEPGGAILTDYLRPEIFTIYTDEDRSEMVKNYRIVPDPAGNIRVFKKFWKFLQNFENVAPPLLVYVDLLNTGDSRCIETAKLVYDRFLK